LSYQPLDENDSFPYLASLFGLFYANNACLAGPRWAQSFLFVHKRGINPNVT